MNTIEKNVENEIIIKNSRFIALLYKLNDFNQIDNYLKKVRIKYPKATHYVYAYIYNEQKKCSDDNEPSNTAGSPILNVLEQSNLNKILVIVVRYFGGIKLGAGGLVRAYTKSVTEALKNTSFINLVPGKRIKIIANYSNQKQLDYILKDSVFINQSFQEKIEYDVLVKDKDIEKLNMYDYKIISDEYIEEKNT